MKPQRTWIVPIAMLVGLSVLSGCRPSDEQGPPPPTDRGAGPQPGVEEPAPVADKGDPIHGESDDVDMNALRKLIQIADGQITPEAPTFELSHRRFERRVPMIEIRRTETGPTAKLILDTLELRVRGGRAVRHQDLAGDDDVRGAVAVGPGEVLRHPPAVAALRRSRKRISLERRLFVKANDAIRRRAAGRRPLLPEAPSAPGH